MYRMQCSITIKVSLTWCISSWKRLGFFIGDFVKLFTRCNCNMYRYILQSHISITQGMKPIPCTMSHTHTHMHTHAHTHAHTHTHMHTHTHAHTHTHTHAHTHTHTHIHTYCNIAVAPYEQSHRHSKHNPSKSSPIQKEFDRVTQP